MFKEFVVGEFVDVENVVGVFECEVFEECEWVLDFDVVGDE